MTINTQPRPISYNGDGVVANFAITWKYFAKSHVVATLRSAAGVETTWVLDTDYTLTTAGDPSGGTLTATVAPASGTKLVISLDPPNTQLKSLPLGGAFPSTSVEEGLDLGAQRDGKIEALLDRVLKVPTTDAQTGASLNLPIDTERASKFLAFDANGKPFASVGSSDSLGPVSAYMATVLDDPSAPVARQTLGFESAAAYASFSAAITAIGSAQKTLLISSSMSVTGNVTVPSNVSLRFHDSGQLNISNSVTVTINGSVEAPLIKIFSGAGTAVFGAGYIACVYPQWWGAIGNGSADDTAAVQSTMNAFGSSGGRIVFPSGTYLLNPSTAAGITITSKNKLRISGNYATLKRHSSASTTNQALFTFTTCQDLTIEGLIFDINGNLTFGGALKFYDCKYVRVFHNRFIDSSPGTVTSDRYFLLFSENSSGAGNAEYCWIRGNYFDGGQVEIIARSVFIEGNEFLNAVNRAIAIATAGNDRDLSYIHIRGNTFKNTRDSFIGIANDPSTDTGALVDNISITANLFWATANGASEAITIASTGVTNFFRNITIANNTMHDTIGQGFIKIDGGGNRMTGLNISDNTYRSDTTSVSEPYFFKFFEVSIISGNAGHGSTITNAMRLDNFFRSTIKNNIMEATATAYNIVSPAASTSGINEFRNNKTLGSPTTTFTTNDVQNADHFDVDEADIQTVTVTGSSFRRDGRGVLKLTAASAQTVDNIFGFSSGQEITLIFTDSNVSLGDSTGNMRLAGGFTGTSNDTMTLQAEGSVWYEKSRSVN